MSLPSKLGMSVMQAFIDDAAFLHDDWNPALGSKDWDAYDTNPFLLGADTVVVSTMSGFGLEYVDRLTELGLFPKNIIIPRESDSKWQTLTNRLVNDDQALGDLLSRMGKKPNISSFYAYQTHVLRKAISHFRDSADTPDVLPPPDEFGPADNKVSCRRILENTSIPIPLGRVCEDLSDLRFFIKNELPSEFHQVIIKYGHRDTEIYNREQILAIQFQSEKFPFVVEACYDFIFSPVSQGIRYEGNEAHIFTLAQKIENLKFCGNTNLPEEYRFLENECIDIFLKVLAEFPEFEGVFGVDFILTKSKKLLVVDVNPRFNSSTYPFYFVENLRQCQKVVGDYGTIKNYGFEDLSDVAASLEGSLYSGRLERGILLFNPVLDPDTSKLLKWSYLLVGDDFEALGELKVVLEESLKLGAKPRRTAQL